ncbi:putative transmembrane protein [Anaerovibrio sp. JC8]|uniref:hypothetical protein n=1 Tax=Anaerovibrio sp. JC8 TaxID=1240085 RepID=UPI000A0E6793|nr:hypothetical protein [Anaerovibrio sp. JC8]ORU00096.1 putative transmembrane protein [Anaerovibrio sp. JC8]
MINGQKITGRMVMTVILLVLFLLVMSFHHIPKILHEIIGLVWLIAALIHIWQNRRWFTSFGKGQWDLVRAINTIISIGLIIGLLVAVAAGSGISHHLFKGIMPMDIRRSITLQQLHVSLPYYLLIFMGLHWGLHFDSWLSQWKNALNIDLPAKASRIIAVVLPMAIIFGGIYGSILNRVGDRLLMLHIFGTEAVNEPMGIYVLLLLAIMGMYVVIGRFIRKNERYKRTS